MLSERSYGQRLQDDEDHRLAPCGFSPDVRSGEELVFCARCWAVEGAEAITAASSETEN